MKKAFYFALGFGLVLYWCFVGCIFSRQHDVVESSLYQVK